MANFIAVLVAVITTSGTIITALIVSKRGTDKKLNEIHVLVNARLTEALNEITKLRSYIAEVEIEEIKNK